MAITRMGFEGKIYSGVAGAEATTELENTRDITYTGDHERGETTVRGDGSAPPMKTERVVTRVASIEWEMTNRDGDTALADLLEAAYSGDPIALRTKDKAAGMGFDGDVTLTVTHGKPLKGEQTFRFTASPTDAAGRDPVPYT
jgi:hypothetical protein